MDAAPTDDVRSWRLDDGAPGRWLGGFLLVMAVVCAIGTVSSAGETHSYRFGAIGPTARLLFTGLGVLLALFLSAGGLFCLAHRAGLVVDRRDGSVSLWSSWLGLRSSRRWDLGRFTRVEARRTRRLRSRSVEAYDAFSVWLASEAGEGLCIQAWLADAEAARRDARDLAAFLGLEFCDRTAATWSGPPLPSGAGEVPGQHVPPAGTEATRPKAGSPPRGECPDRSERGA